MDVLEEVEIHKRPHLASWEFVPHQRIRHYAEEQGKEGNDADSPSEANSGLKLSKNDWEDKAS